MNPDRWASIAEAAEYWGVEFQTIWRALRNGHVPARSTPRSEGSTRCTWEVLLSPQYPILSFHGKREAMAATVRERAEKLPPTLIAYFAGLFDGEGSVSKFKRTAPRVEQVAIGIGNTCREPLNLLATALAGHVRFHQKTVTGKDYYVWKCAGAEAEAVLEVLLPYLIIKKPQAEVAFRVLALRMSQQKYRESTERNELLRQLEELNC